MSKKFQSKIGKLEEIMRSSEDNEKYGVQWCLVDTHNFFKYKNSLYRIDNSVEGYKVINPPVKKENGEYNDWENKSFMDSILVVDYGDKLIFYDQDINIINNGFVKQVQI